MEEVSVNYGKIIREYKPQRADGTLGSVIRAGYNLKENKQV